METEQRASQHYRTPLAPALISSKFLAMQCPYNYNFNIIISTMPRLPADTAVFPSHDHVFEPQNNEFQSAASSRGRLFSNPYAQGFHHGGVTSQMYEQELKFPPVGHDSFEENVEIELPDIRNYVPPKTDVDAANALTALYRTHCTSLIDSIRYCKEKQFYRLFTSFHGTLTVPVQKLFAHPDIAPWIKECDWLMYQKMIRNVSQLTLQVAPPTVLRFLDTISKSLHTHISKVFQGLPLHVLEAKLKPATLFAHLLHRMLRVNSTAHAAAVMLMVDQNRDQMWSDWVMFVNAKRIMESELPDCGYEEVYKILTQEIRGLLLPLNTPWLDNGSYYQESASNSGNGNASNETVIDRLAAFLAGLPARFPHAKTRTLLQCISAIGSAAIREITVENGMSYGSWWITKVFVDEMSLWLASLGGFLDHKPPNFNHPSLSPGAVDGPLDSAMMNGGSGSNNDSRYSSIGADFTTNQSFMTTVDDAMQGTGPSENESKF
jgi:regulatory factor X, other